MKSPIAESSKAAGHPAQALRYGDPLIAKLDSFPNPPLLDVVIVRSLVCFRVMIAPKNVEFNALEDGRSI